MDNKTFNQAAALIAPENNWRPFSAGSVLMLEMLENPLSSLNPEIVDALSEFHLLSAVMLHAIPLREAQCAAIAARNNAEGFRALVLEWAETQPITIFSQAYDWALTQTRRCSDSMAVMLRPGESKNGSGPSSS